MAKTMKAVVVTEPGKVQVVHDAPMPEIGEYEALVRVRACAFCNGTDQQIIAGQLFGIDNVFPTVLGHEGTGEVVELGKRVRNIELGDRVFAPLNVPNEKYFATMGNMCEYAFVVDYQAMEDDGLGEEMRKKYPPRLLGKRFNKKLPEQIDSYAGAIMVPMLESCSAVSNFGITENMDVLVYGAGPMGLTVMTFMRLKGAKSITAIDYSSPRLAAAKKTAKLDLTINPKEEDVDKILAGREFDAVIDIVGRSSILIEGSQRLKPFGKVCSMGVLHGDDACFNVQKLKNNTSLQMLNFPYATYTAQDFVFDSIVSGRLDPKDLYSHIMPVEEIEECIDLVRSGQATKVILTL